MITVENKPSSTFERVSDGIHPAVCVGIINLGPVMGAFQGKPKVSNKVKIVWEVEEKTAAGAPKSISKNYTLSLHAKAALNKDLSCWRGKPIGDNEKIELDKLIGASCSLVVSTQVGETGKEFTGVTAISKPTKKLTPSGQFKMKETIQRLREWSAKNNSSHKDEVFAEQLGEFKHAGGGDVAPEGVDPDVGF
jgi:hypothetical protein